MTNNIVGSWRSWSVRFMVWTKVLSSSTWKTVEEKVFQKCKQSLNLFQKRHLPLAVLAVSLLLGLPWRLDVSLSSLLNLYANIRLLFRYPVWVGAAFRCRKSMHISGIRQLILKANSFALGSPLLTLFLNNDWEETKRLV